MPTVFTHAVLAAAAFSFVAHGRPGARLGAVAAAGLCMLPDIDIMWWDYTSYGAPWGHRGMTHSLAAAAVLAAIATLALRKRVTVPGGATALFALFFAATASHGLCDALTDGGKGVGFFLPFSEERYFMPLRPVPVAPIRAGFGSAHLWRVLGAEVLLFWPLAFAMWSARRPQSRGRVAVVAVTLFACAITWGWRSAT